MVCSHDQRADIEVQLLDGSPVSAIASSFEISRTSLRRHRDHHLSLPTWDPEGLSPLSVLDQLQEVAGRLGDIADAAEEAGRLDAATRALQGQAKTLALLAHLGVRDGAQPVRDAAALQRALVELILQSPAVGDQLAEFLENDNPQLAGSIAGYAGRCRAYIASISGNNKEATHDQRTGV